MRAGRGLAVLNTTYYTTTYISSHMTLYGAGFFVQPNAVDFKFIYAQSDFQDNILVYSTILISIILYMLFLIMAKIKDLR